MLPRKIRNKEKAKVKLEGKGIKRGNRRQKENRTAKNEMAVCSKICGNPERDHRGERNFPQRKTP